MSVDIWDLSVVALAAIGFAATLQAAGAILFGCLFDARLPTGSGRIGCLARTASLTGAGAAIVRQLLMAAQMAGSASGLVDARVHELLLTSDAGTATSLRVLGLILIAGSATRAGPAGRVLPIVGAVLATLSFTLVGHTVANPVRPVLLPLLLMHLGIAAFWFGGLVPLRIVLAAELGSGAAAGILQCYSRLASRLVPGIAAIGVALALLLSSKPEELIRSPYGQLLAIKLTLFMVLMVPAALNKLRWVPALAVGDDGARRALRRSISAEIVLIVLVLVTTAVLTSLTSPPAAEGAAGW